MTKLPFTSIAIGTGPSACSLNHARPNFTHTKQYFTPQVRPFHFSEISWKIRYYSVFIRVAESRPTSKNVNKHVRPNPRFALCFPTPLTSQNQERNQGGSSPAPPKPMGSSHITKVLHSLRCIKGITGWNQDSLSAYLIDPPTDPIIQLKIIGDPVINHVGLGVLCKCSWSGLRLNLKRNGLWLTLFPVTHSFDS